MAIKTQFDDAASIVGEELAEAVETELTKRKINKSAMAQLIQRSIDEADNETVERSEPEDAAIVGSPSTPPLTERPVTLITFFKKLASENGIEITEDEITAMVNEAINGLTDRSEPVENAPEVEKCMDQSSAVPVVVVQDYSEVEEWKPFGGATTLAEVSDYEAAEELKWKVYNFYWKLMDVAENVMKDEELTSEQRLQKMQQLLTEASKLATPDAIMAMKAAYDEEVKATVQPVVQEVVRTEPAPELHPIIVELNQAFETTVAITNLEQRTVAFTAILERAQSQFSQLNETLPVEVDPDAVVRGEVAELKDQISQLTSLVNQLSQNINAQTQMAVQTQRAVVAPVAPTTTRRTAPRVLKLTAQGANLPIESVAPQQAVPVRKSVVHPIQPLQPVAPKPAGGKLNVAEIVNRTVYSQ